MSSPSSRSVIVDRERRDDLEHPPARSARRHDHAALERLPWSPAMAMSPVTDLEAVDHALAAHGVDRRSAWFAAMASSRSWVRAPLRPDLRHQLVVAK